MLQRITRQNNFPRCIFHNNYSLTRQTNDLPDRCPPDNITESKVLTNLDVQDLEDVAPYLKPSFNFAQYINKSVSLQQLFNLGVNLHKLEKDQDVAKFILGLDYQEDVAKYVQFFDGHGVDDEGVAEIITKNPFILREDIGDLEVRINYLASKKFTSDAIQRIVVKNPFWLSYSTQEIDKMLGYLQKTFSLTGDNIRSLIVACPRLATYNQHNIKVMTFSLQEEMGFTPEETTEILLEKPRLFMKDHRFVLKTFEYLTNDMQIPRGQIVQQPGILTCRQVRLKQRHLFLKKLGRDQFDPHKPNYVSLLSLVADRDSFFSTATAKSSVQTYNTFLKTM